MRIMLFFVSVKLFFTSSRGQSLIVSARMLL